MASPVSGSLTYHPPRRPPNILAARLTPLFLVALVAFVAYTLTGPLVVNHLLRQTDPRLALALAVLIPFHILLLLTAIVWLRLTYTVLLQPGHVPLGPYRTGEEPDPAPGLDAFWHRDVFVCDARGLPLWCPHCNAWKPDRAHHSQDLGRCTTKMDHFCPWVGGVVGERSWKFFLQFNTFAFVMCAYTVGVFAYFVAESSSAAAAPQRQADPITRIMWFISLGLGGFFGLFTGGMLVNGWWITARNVTTIENIDQSTRTLLLAVLLPPELQRQPLSALPLHPRICRGTITYPLHLPIDRPPLPAAPPRVFAVLETLPGMNIWDLGSKRANLAAVLGRSPYDWLLPVTHSPCCAHHASHVSQYPLGPDFERLLVQAGLATRRAPAPVSGPLSADVPGVPGVPSGVSDGDAGISNAHAKRRRRRRRRLEDAWRNDERPDGWVSAKEARRRRNQARRAAQSVFPP